MHTTGYPLIELVSSIYIYLQPSSIMVISRDKDTLLNNHSAAYNHRVRNYWLSGTPKNTVGKPIFLQGFRTGKPVKINFLVI